MIMAYYELKIPVSEISERLGITVEQVEEVINRQSD